jgi:hypothetical protein
VYILVSRHREIIRAKDEAIRGLAAAAAARKAARSPVALPHAVHDPRSPLAADAPPAGGPPAAYGGACLTVLPAERDLDDLGVPELKREYAALCGGAARGRWAAA